MTDVCNFQRTQYPIIFKKVWWGMCGEYRGEYAHPEIVSNRNAFIKEHNIVAHKLATNKLLTKQILPDVKNNIYESYQDGHGRIVIICDNYKIDTPSTWAQIAPLFALNGKTTIHKFETDKSKHMLTSAI